MKALTIESSLISGYGYPIMSLYRMKFKPSKNGDMVCLNVLYGKYFSVYGVGFNTVGYLLEVLIRLGIFSKVRIFTSAWS